MGEYDTVAKEKSGPKSGGTEQDAAALQLPPGVTLLASLAGHKDAVVSVAFDPQGETLASGSHDKTVKLWEARTGKLLRTLDGNTDRVYSVAFDRQGETLASGSHDKTVKLWEARSGQLLRTLEGHNDEVYSVAFDRQGETLASASGDNTVKLWEARSGQLLHTLEGHQNLVLSVAFDRQGETLASGGHDKTVKLWEARSGQLLRTLEGHTGLVDCVAFSADGRLLASKSNDHTIRLWSCATWETVAVIAEPTHYDWIPALAFHPTLPRLATVGSKPNTPDGERCRLIHVWNLDLAVLLDRSLGFQPEQNDGRAGSPTYEGLSHTDSHYRNAKVVLVGNSSVGKSGLGLVLAGRKFRATESTHGRHIWLMESVTAVGRVLLPVESAAVNASLKTTGRDAHPTTTTGRDAHPTTKTGRDAHRTDTAETRETLLWDLAGQPGYRLVHQLHLHEISVALVLFDARSETEPFSGVSYWARAIDSARRENFPLKKFLVAARCDRGSAAVSQQRIDEIVQRYGFDGYFETSAKRGDGVEDLRAALCDAIKWDDLPAVTRTSEFKITKDFLVAKKRRGTIIEESAALFQDLLKSVSKRRQAPLTRAVFDACLQQLETTGLIRRLPFGASSCYSRKCSTTTAAGSRRRRARNPMGSAFCPRKTPAPASLRWMLTDRSLSRGENSKSRRCCWRPWKNPSRVGWPFARSMPFAIGRCWCFRRSCDKNCRTIPAAIRWRCGSGFTARCGASTLRWSCG